MTTVLQSMGIISGKPNEYAFWRSSISTASIVETIIGKIKIKTTVGNEETWKPLRLQVGWRYSLLENMRWRESGNLMRRVAAKIIIRTKGNWSIKNGIIPLFMFPTKKVEYSVAAIFTCKKIQFQRKRKISKI